LAIASPKTSGNCAERGDSVDSKLQRQNGEYGGGTATKVYQQTTRSRQKTARRPVAKKRDRPLHARSLLLFQIELKHIR